MEKIINRLLVSKSGLITLFLILSLLVIVGGYYTYSTKERGIQSAYTSELLLVSKSRVTQIQSWWEEKIEDGNSLKNNKSLSLCIEQLLKNKNDVLKRNSLKEKLSDLISHDDYSSALLVAPRDYLILLTTDTKGSKFSYAEDQYDSLKSKDVFLSDFHKTPLDVISHINLMVAIYSPIAKEKICFLVIAINMKKKLANMLNEIPDIDYNSGNIFVSSLVDSSSFLNEPYSHDGSGLSFKKSSNDTLSRVVKTVANLGIMIQGNDYSGRSVIASIQPIKNTRWFLITQMDAGEITNPIGVFRNKVLITVILVLIFLWVVYVYIVYHEKFTTRSLNNHLLFQNLLLEKQYSSLIENANDIILLVSDDGSILRTNSKAREIYGFHENELLKMKLDDIRVKKMTDKLKSKIRDDNNLSGFLFENFHYKKDGSMFPVEESIFSIKIENMDYQQNLIRDLTDKEKMEQKSLENERLITIGKTLGYLSHQIKSPLSSMKMGIAEVKKSPELSEFSRKIVSLSSTTIDSLLLLFNEIEYYVNEIVLELHPTNTHSKINIIIEVLKKDINSKQIEFINRVEDISLVVDPNEFQIMFIKLFENSIEAIRDKGIIEVYSQRDPGGHFLDIFIKDSGEGIKNCEKIFEPFYTTKRAGIGLGLPIAKKIIKQHNGNIKIVSSLPGETIFMLSVPLNGEI